MRLTLVLIALAACSSPSSKKPDAPPADVTFTGEYVDWDSSDTGAFCGIFNATWVVRGDATRTDMTNPNGRFTLMVPGSGQTLVDITPATADSECLTPTSHYTLPGIAVADPAVIASGQMISARSFTVARQATVGATLDAAKGHVFVHVDGTQSAVSVSADSDPAQAWSGSAWAAGSTGVNVFFPNVTVGMTAVSMGTAVGTGAVPVEAGKITYVTLVAQ